MPMIQLKPQHEHPKNKLAIVNQLNDQLLQKTTILETQPVSLPTGIAKKQSPVQSDQNSKIVPFKQSKELKQQPKIKDKKPPHKQQKPPSHKQQKPLNVQIIQKQPTQNKKQKNIQSLDPQILNQNAKKDNKKKKKNLLIQEEIPYDMRLMNRTSQLYKNFNQKREISFSRNHLQLADILRQSFTTFAADEIKEQINVSANGLNPSDTYLSVKDYNSFLFDQLWKRKKIHEDRIYFGVLQQNQCFNDLIWREQITSKPKKQEVKGLFSQIHLLVINDVWDGQYEIKEKQKPSKDELLYGNYKANQIRMAESIIKQKLSNLNGQFSLQIDGDQKDQSKFHNHKKFDLNSEETKKAEEFIKKLQQEDKLMKQRIIRKRQIEEQEEIQRIQAEKKAQELLQKQKIEERKAKIQEKAIYRQKQKQYREVEHSKYLTYLSQHHDKVPLFKKKEEDFKAFLIKQHIRKLDVMRQHRSKKRSVSKDQIQLHQQKYAELKQLLDEQRQQMLRLEEDQCEQSQKTYYRGPFYNSILNLVNNQTLSDQKKSKAEQLFTKKIQYSTIVKNQFIPKIDERKKQQLQRLIKDLSPKPIDDKYLAEKIKMEGQRNLQRLHLFIGQHRAKGKVKKSISQNESIENIKEKKPRYSNYLDQIKASRMQNSTSMRKSRFNSLDLSKINRQSVGLLEMQARNLEQHADRKSLYLRNTKHLDIEDYLQKKFQLQEDYIESAKAKITALNRYKMGD